MKPKEIMISIKPKWCAKIMNGEKTIEVRKNKALANAIQKLIDENGFADIYVYCSKDGYLHLEDKNKGEWSYSRDKKYTYVRTGKVAFKFRCCKVEEFPYISAKYDKLIGSCLSEKELLDYSTIKFENGIRFVKTIYAIHISDLEIFDRPRELSEFKYNKKFVSYDYTYTKKYIDWELRPLTKAPQNFCYVEV